MHVTHATMQDIEIKGYARGTRMGSNVSLEVGEGGMALGNQVIVRIWVDFDPSQTPLKDVQTKAAAEIHRVLQAAAASSADDLAALLSKSVAAGQS